MKPGQAVKIKQTGRETTIQVLETWPSGEVSAVFVGDSADMETWVKFYPNELETTAEKPKRVEEIEIAEEADVLALLAEIVRLKAELETVRAERDALRAALEAVRDQAVSAQQDWELASPIYARAIVRIAETALTAQPAPQREEWTPERLTDFTQRLIREGETEWTPREGDHVELVNDDRGIAVVTRIIIGEFDGVAHYMTTFSPWQTYLASELKPAAES